MTSLDIPWIKSSLLRVNSLLWSDLCDIYLLSTRPRFKENIKIGTVPCAPFLNTTILFIERGKHYFRNDMYYFRVSSEIRVARTSETKEMAAMTAFNIFIRKCREEHKIMFPEEQLGKPRHVSIVTVFF